MNLLFIDPSIRRLGWAVFRVEPGRRRAKLKDSGFFALRKKKGRTKDRLAWVRRCDIMAHLLNTEVLSKYPPKHIFIEMPRVYQSGRGKAASNSGAILKLAFCVATLRIRLQQAFTEIHLLPVQIWKGNLPKFITQRRVQKHWGTNKNMDHNEADAIGMGDFICRQKMKLRPT